MVFPLKFLISIVYNHLQYVSYLYKPSRLKHCKNSSFKVENFKIFDPTGACWGKKFPGEGEGGKND